MMNSKRTTKGTTSETAARTGQETLGISDQEFQEMGEVGAIYYRQGNLEKARAIFEGLVEINPDNANAQSALGALLTRTKEYDAALPHLTRAIELDSGQIAPYVNRAEIYIRQQQATEAVADLKRAIALDPEEANPAAHRARAMVLGINEALKTTGAKQTGNKSGK